HYFILLLPAFAVLAGAAVSLAMQSVPASRAANVLKTLPPILFATVLGWMIYYQAPFFFQLSPTQVSRSLYRMNPVEESVVAGDYLREHSAPDARIAVI